VPFDVIFIHVCSLSWDDIAAVGLEQHPLWQRFDFLFKKFNSAASYSAPAAIHLLRSTCGQQAHDRMYSPAPPNCYLMSSLQAVGFEPNLALNHTGKFDDFLSQVQMQGGLNVPMLSLDGLDVAQNAFNNSPVYDDLAVLNRWLKSRQKSGAPRVALYYNTVSLHDGNHLPGPRARPDTPETYRKRLVKFLDETEAFMQKLDESGRRAVVVMVPEHGAAVRGDKRQIAGLRDTPTPAITLVPVGIKVVGSNREGNTLSIDHPTSYMAISSLVARMLEKSPYTSNKFLPSDYVADLPVTLFVAQTDKTTVAWYNQRYYLNNDSGGWENYAEFNTPAVSK
jgi:cellulose synthase operon protein YhjU